ncbi:MAG TPA: hypothetical protein VKT53_08455 [Candidatus Acidoferrum sp.]|nr:hypothetical protein [Candidatus Acidoferrum sp.]
MTKLNRFALCAVFAFVFAERGGAQTPSNAVVFSEPGFPNADSPAISADQMAKLVPGARLASVEQLKAELAKPETKLLVLAYGSAFPEAAWAEIFSFLKHGGNLLAVGGRPFTRAAYKDATGWHLRNYSVRFLRQLSIDQYQTAPGSDGLEFRSNPDFPANIPSFGWKKSFSPVIRLSAVDLYARGGSAGSIDARLDALAFAMQRDRRMADPVLEVDHLQNGFNGGRWILLPAELTGDFFTRAETGTLVRTLAERASQGAESFTVRPTVPLYLPGEPVEAQILWNGFGRTAANLTVKLSMYPQDQPTKKVEAISPLPASEPILLPAPAEKGFHIIEAQLLEGTIVRQVYRSGFWLRDLEYLNSGPKLSVNRDYFELDGKPLGVVGTTYMSSEVQRLYFEHPNAYVWDQDLAQIHSAGLNMIRSGWWTGWDKFFDENGQPYDRTFRTLEAFLMTARKHGLPVQFNFFAFLPDVLGGSNSYLDPETVHKQETLISAVAARFKNVPWLAWDLINEPSISKRLWTMRPNEDWIETQKWNEWLAKRYPDRAALAAAWNLPVTSVEGSVSLPQEIEFNSRGMYIGRNSLKAHDYMLFAQDVFAEWAQRMRDTVRASGSQQLVTIGQDEGGIMDRPSPAFYGKALDFLTNHTWWQNDSLLWDSLFAKQPGQALLIQETGLQREMTLDEIARFTPEQESYLFERKVATSFVQSSGTIEWLWNSNSYMTEGNETPIGAIRPDGTEKPEAAVLRDFASLSKQISEHLRSPELPAIAIVTSQAAQYSAVGNLQIDAQHTAIRALAYDAHLTAYVVAENQIERLGAPKLAILPSPQALNEVTWQALMKYVSGGGNLLVTGPVGRDEHWQTVDRMSALKANGQVSPLWYHNASIRLGSGSVPLSFTQDRQFWAEVLNFENGETFAEIPVGKGKIYWAAFPVELAEEVSGASELYRYVAQKVGLSPAFELQSPLPSGVLIFPTVLEDSVLYVLTSEAAAPAQITLRDKLTGTQLNFVLPPERAAVALISKEKRAVIAKYGF